jgi:hypothetical protein
VGPREAAPELWIKHDVSLVCFSMLTAAFGDNPKATSQPSTSQDTTGQSLILSKRSNDQHQSRQPLQLTRGIVNTGRKGPSAVSETVTVGGNIH